HSEQERTLLPCRQQGQSLWVCTRCLPALIHG
ncbi:MAG: ferredoxin, partial [Anaerolineae bacterium]|nr:ferredoxin [Anaerolineae bacterium]